MTQCRDIFCNNNAGRRLTSRLVETKLNDLLVIPVPLHFQQHNCSQALVLF